MSGSDRSTEQSKRGFWRDAGVMVMPHMLCWSGRQGFAAVACRRVHKTNHGTRQPSMAGLTKAGVALDRCTKAGL